MLRNRLVLLSLVLCYTFAIFSETIDTTFYNGDKLKSIFIKLKQLEESHEGKINIVQIGDSHIQANFLSEEIRQELQNQFGDGGTGFTFPYKLIKTNSNSNVKYKSNQPWQHVNVLKSAKQSQIGLSGISFYTNSQRFFLELISDSNHTFNTIKLFYTTKNPMFDLSFVRPDLPQIQDQYVLKKHTVKSGESLSAISAKYHVSIVRIKEANHLKSNLIHAGKTLLIPSKEVLPVAPVKSTVPLLPENELIKQSYEDYSSVYSNVEDMNSIVIIPKKRDVVDEYNLSGIVLENNQPGIVYHNIGVNGAKSSDFESCPLFFKHLKLLNPDLIILSFGTNESFGNVEASTYFEQITSMASTIQQENKDAVIIITTPSPSFIKKKYPNRRVATYTDYLINQKDWVVWDLFSKMGGLSVKPTDLTMGKLKIHYSPEGYANQGALFCSEFLNAYYGFLDK